MRLQYGIASYKRPECKTIDMLVSAGISEKNIYVSLQEESQVDEYKRNHPNVQYIVKNADCAAGNRNTLIDTLSAPYVLLDDDCNSIAIKRPGQQFKKATKKAEFEPWLEKAVLEAQKNHCQLVGVAATTNDLVARGRNEYSYDVLLQGSFLIILADGIRFDDHWKMVEDYELSLRVIMRGHTLRANYISVFKPKNGTNKGGLHERYMNGELPKWIARLEKSYPLFKANKAKTGGSVRFGR